MWKITSIIILVYLIENIVCKFTLNEPFITFYKPKGMRVHMKGKFQTIKTCYLFTLMFFCYPKLKKKFR